MKPVQEYEQDLASIRSMMERSFKFISLSGLSGVLAGVYALGGSVAAYFVARYPVLPCEMRTYSIQPLSVITQLLTIAAVVLILSIGTGLWLSSRKAKKHGLTLWTAASRRMFINMIIPLAS